MDPFSNIEEAPPYEVIEFLYGDGIDTEFSVVCRRHRFAVRISQSDLHEEDRKDLSTIEADYHRLLVALGDDDSSGIQDLNPEGYDSLQVMYHWIATPFFLRPRSLLFTSEVLEYLQTLDEYAHSHTLFFHLKSIQGRLTPVPDT
ncbi:hypothetical protein LTR67_010216 [Exophiala xenobiotica]